MTQKRQMIALLLSGALLGAAAPARAVVNEYQTLELVRTYASDEEFRAANEKMLREKHPIVDDGTFIKFIDPETGNVLKQIKKEQTFEEMMANLTETERQQMADPVNPQTFVKRFNNYFIPSSYESEPYLQVVEYKTAISEHVEGEGYDKLLSSTIYNRQGERVIDLPLDVDRITLAPNQHDFVAHTVDPVTPGEVLYFYTDNGKTVKKVPFPHGYLDIHYSADSEYLALLNGQNFYIFTKYGELVLSANFHEATEDYSGLERLFVSNNATYILLTTSKHTVLLNREGIRQWKIPHPSGTMVYGAFFDIPRGRVYLRSSDSDWMRVISLSDGMVIEELTGISFSLLVDQTFYLKKEGRYEEYRIK